MMLFSISKLYVAGAGPGDPELLTLKALKALQQADVILYDDLASKALLAHAKPKSILVYVGKRRGRYAYTQQEINELIVMYATQYRTIMRLKGGDPFVFGRGHEEMVYALQHGLAVEMVPGISSALAAPASVGIPLTKRGVNESFWVITGTLSDGSMSRDIALAAQSTATVVILMGMSRLQQIVETCMQARTPDEPIAIVQHATMETQQCVRGTLQNIQAKVQAQSISSPAVIIIGNVVNECLEDVLPAINNTSAMRIAV